MVIFPSCSLTFLSHNTTSNNSIGIMDIFILKDFLDLRMNISLHPFPILRLNSYLHLLLI